MTLTSSVRSITPALAQRWLNTQHVNRSPRQTYVDQLAGAMERGEWELNGEAIVLDATGNLLDGQHRLLAVVQSGKTIRSVVVEGVDAKAFATIDSGRSRTLKDVLQIRGEGFAGHLAAALNWLAVYRRTGQFRLDHSGPQTIHQAELLLAGCPGLRESVKAGDAATRRQRLGISGPLLGAMHYVFSEIEASDAEFFFEQLRVGAGMATTDPIQVLRERLLAAAGSRSQRALTATEATALVIKAWNLYRSGERITTIRWMSGGAHAEPYPEPR